jgi:parvulin-like peptidyl-prolyl isomerase
MENYDEAAAEFVAKKITDVPDSVVTVTDADYQAYFDAHKEVYKKDATRGIKYVVFNVEPSAKDIEKAKKDILSIKKELEQIPANEVARYLTVNSDVPYDSSWKVKGELPVEIDEVMFSETPGYVSDYWFSNNKYHLARLMDKAVRPDSMKASHILIAFKGAYRANPAIDRTREEAQKLADSLYKVIKRRPSQLEAIAQTYSDDPSAKQNKGDLGWFKDGRMVPSFNEAVVKTKVGDVTLVESPFGFHIVKVTGKKDNVTKVRVAELVYEVLPSNETYQNIFAKASKIASEAHNAEAFESKAKEMGVPVLTQPTLYEMTATIRNFHNVRPVIRWAFNEETEEGDVSGVFDLDGAYMVALLTSKSDEGYPELEEIKPQLERAVVNKKKGEYLAQQMAAAGKDLEAVAKAMNTTVEKDNVKFVDRNLGSYPRANKAIGTLFGLDKGEVSEPVADFSAVFVLKQLYIKSDPENAENNYQKIVKKLESQFQNMVNSEAHYRAMEKASDIVDNRIKFF